jgi:two-component system response regulator YesN
MNKVARRFNLSPSHFSTIFSQELGEPFRDYLGNIRINRAKGLLRSTNLKIAEVAYQCGYSDPHYFSYVFKKKTGQTPQQFRLESQDTHESEVSL